MKEDFNEGSMVGEIDGIVVVGIVLGESVGYDDGTNDGFPLGDLLG